MLLRFLLATILTTNSVAASAAPAAGATPYEDLIAEATQQQEVGNPIEASETFLRAFDAMPADVKRQDIGEELGATLHFEARYTAWRYTGNVEHLEQAKRVLDVLLAEQQAAVIAGSREAVSVDAQQKLAKVKEDLAFAKKQTPSVVPDPIVGPTPTPPVILRAERPDLSAPIALLSVGAVLGVAGLACIIGGEGSRAYNKNQYENSSPAKQAENPTFLDDINKTSTGVTVAGAVALLGGVAMLVPGAILYKRRTAVDELSLAPLSLPRGGGAAIRLRF